MLAEAVPAHERPYCMSLPKRIEQAYRKAIALNLNHALAHHYYAQAVHDSGQYYMLGYYLDRSDTNLAGGS